jgi:hypothetical protein
MLLEHDGNGDGKVDFRSRFTSTVVNRWSPLFIKN